MRAISRVLGINQKMVSCQLVQAAQALPACPSQTEACSFIEIDELCTSIAKKNSQCWLWLAIDSIFGKVLGFVFGRRTIKTGNVSWQQIKHLPTMDYGTDLLKAYENFIPHAKHYTGKTFTTKQNHSTADSGIIQQSSNAKRFATANQKRCWNFLGKSSLLN